MIKKINRTEQIMNGATILNEPKHIEAIIQLNEEMEIVRRDFKRKSNESYDSATVICKALRKLFN